MDKATQVKRRLLLGIQEVRATPIKFLSGSCSQCSAFLLPRVFSPHSAEKEKIQAYQTLGKKVAEKRKYYNFAFRRRPRRRFLRFFLLLGALSNFEAVASSVLSKL